MDLHNRVALVTGAAHRVGNAIALRLAQAGCHIAVHSHASAAAARETAEDCQAFGVRAECFAADLADADATARVVSAVVAAFGRLDVLVNNAAVFEEMSLDDFTVEAWERTFRINLTAPIVLAHAARDALRAARGRIVNLGDASVGQPWPQHLAYCVSKAGVHALTQSLARAFAPDVNVVGVAPGVAAWPAHYSAETRERLVRKIPLGRAGAPHDIAAAVHFLLTEGDYITGVVLPVDGGRHLR